MKKISTEIKWALIFVAMSLLWMLLEKLSGLHSTHIDKHMPMFFGTYRQDSEAPEPQPTFFGAYRKQ